MRRDFDIFEKFSDGSTVWHCCVSGQFNAERKIQELAEGSQNAFFAIDIQAGERTFVAQGAPLELAKADKKHNR